MKRIVNASLRSLLALAFVVACGAAVASAQVRDARVISARAGGVNFVSGDVSVLRQGESEWGRVSAKDELKSGDRVRTGQAGRVEVLLNPGSFFRAGGGAEFAFTDDSLEDLRLELARGSAVVEATGYSDLDLSITVATPRTLVRIVRSGIYRIDVDASGAGAVEVWKGRAEVGNMIVKGGKVARGGAAGVEVAKLDKEDRDDLDLWSRERGKELARANEKLSRRGVSMALAHARMDNFSWNGYGYGGFWFWNTTASCYTFLPFYSNWRSPYGFWYGRGYYLVPYNGPGAYGPNGPVYNGPAVTRGGAPHDPPGSPSGPGSPMPIDRGRVYEAPNRPMPAPMERTMPSAREGMRGEPGTTPRRRDQR